MVEENGGMVGGREAHMRLAERVGGRPVASDYTCDNPLGCLYVNGSTVD